MNALLPRFLKSAYRKEPISAFILIVGVVDSIIGGLGERWSLLSVGITISLIAYILRWWQVQKVQAKSEKTAQYFLPEKSSHSPLPTLTSEKYRS